jgi:hypothetical protein
LYAVLESEMTSAAEMTKTSDANVQTIVGGGIKLGVGTAVGVVVFALLTRSLSGTAEMVVQSILIILGGSAFSYVPAILLPPKDADSVAWASMIGLLGSLTFTVIDTILLRPIHLYDWKWDAIGGGSGFWYIPVWWMGAAFLAWLGAWVVANGSKKSDASIARAAGTTAAMAVAVAVVLTLARIVPFHSAGVALAFTIGLILHVPLSMVLNRE